MYLDLENATESTISDEEKLGTLNAALEDPRFAATSRTSVETVALQTGHLIVYDSYLQALGSQAQSMSIATAYGRQSNLTTSQRGRGGGGRHSSGGYGGGRGNGGRGNAGSKWKKDLRTAWVPPSEFAKFTHDEKQKRYDAKTAKKLNSSVNATQTQAATTVTTTEDAMQVSAVTTTPTICEIMAT